MIQGYVLLHTPADLPLVAILPKAWAQSCPDTPVRVVAPFAPGNTLDTVFIAGSFATVVSLVVARGA